MQDSDTLRINADQLQIVSKRPPTEQELRSMLLAWKVCKHVKSNAIVLANEYQTIG